MPLPEFRYYDDDPDIRREHEIVRPDVIRAYGHKYGFRYPESYVEFASNYGAMQPHLRDSFVFETSLKGEYDLDVVTDACNFIPTFDTNPLHVPSFHPELAEWLEEDLLVPIFKTDTSRWVCYDFRRSDTDPIVVLLAPNDVGPGPVDSAVRFVAGTFEEFMDMLTSEEEAEAMLERLNGE